ncbi:MAG: universal stress protein [Pseudomonadota bacterium]
MGGDKTVLRREIGPSADSDCPVILVASNGSERAAHAVRVAGRLAHAEHAQLVCEQIIDPQEGGPGADQALGDLARAVNAALGADPARCVVEICHLSDSYTDEEYGRAVMLADVASRTNAALLIIGVHGGKGGGKLLSTTMTEKLMKVAPCPVLIVTGGAVDAYRKVMVAVDFSEVSFDAVEAGMRFAPGADVVLVHVKPADGSEPDRDGTGGADSMRNMSNVAREDLVGKGVKTVPSGDDRVTTQVLEGTPGDALSQAVAEHQPDLLVLGTRGRTGLTRLIMGSVANKFVADPPCDVLVLRSAG